LSHVPPLSEIAAVMARTGNSLWFTSCFSHLYLRGFYMVEQAKGVLEADFHHHFMVHMEMEKQQYF